MKTLLKKLLLPIVLCILTLVIFEETSVHAEFVGFDIDYLDIAPSILTKIKSFGIDVQNTACDELEPDNLISYKDFMDTESQKRDSFNWSTACPNRIDKLNMKIRSSSELQGYPLKNGFDKKTDTAWVEGVKGEGTGEWLSIELNPEINSTHCPVGLSYFGMIPGYLKSDKTWEENNRVESALLIMERYGYDPTGGKGNYIDYVIIRLKFADFKGIQIFDLAYYEGSISTHRNIFIIIENVVKGTKYDDTCISEIVVGGGIAVSFFEP
jgi:hypothetical protein